ncbi:Zn-Finger Containing protein [Lactiplantibacillus plajomi]|uniref:Zn-Finger Containing protein n=1 Tax=Lactiplantibacillus plajomi TaxID=1457217 RepID=A0ABV6K5Q7_9LACO|nr:Zn-Finger Containing protein [Lactiplantibacillus plajomi]
MKPNSKTIQRVQRFMRGRYGQNDHLNRFLTNLSLLLLIISLFLRTQWLILVAILLLAFGYWRLFSKKIYRQVAINRGFERIWLPIIRPFSRFRYWISQHRHYKFFTCESCQQRIRIPRHHGCVRVTCPTCHHQFKART